MSLAKPIQHLNTGYSTKTFTPAISHVAGLQLRLYATRLVNESGGTIIAALFKSMSDPERSFLSFDGANAVDVSNSLNAGNPVPAMLGVAGSGFLVQADERFQALMMVVSAPQAAGALTLRYWNGGAYVAMLQIIDSPPAGLPAGHQIIFFSPGPDWEKGGNIPGQLPNKYTVIATFVGQGGIASVTAASPAQAVQYVPALPNLSSFESAFDVNYPLQFNGQEELIPYFSVASANNKVIAFYSQEN